MGKPVKASKASPRLAPKSPGLQPKKPVQNPIHEMLLDRRAELAEEYKAGIPYPYGVIDGLCAYPPFLHGVREELAQLPMSPKETDLYRLQQSPDLANLECIFAARPDLEDKMKLTTALRDALYAKEFRQFVSDVTGCGPLTDKTDLAAAVYTSGSHLLVHDDVISTRKISFIVYLTDETEADGNDSDDSSEHHDRGEWVEADGGRLELYPGDADGQPAAIPTARLLPKFNRLAFFTVAAGKSFHAVEEVYALGKDRVSIQGWYHCAEEPSAADHAASLKVLKRAARDSDPEKVAVPFVPGLMPKGKEAIEAAKGLPPPAGQLDVDTVEELKTLGLHPMYLDFDNLALMAAEFKEAGVVRLGNLIVPQLVEPLQAALRVVDTADRLGLGMRTPPNPHAGVSPNWELVGPSHLQRFLRLAAAPNTKAEDIEPGTKKARLEEPASGSDDEEVMAAVDAAREQLVAMLTGIRDNLVSSAAFAKFMAALTGPATAAGFSTRTVAARRFRPGLDYTLTTVQEEAPVLDCVFTVCNEVEAEDEDDMPMEEGEEAEGEEGEGEEGEDEDEDEDEEIDEEQVAAIMKAAEEGEEEGEDGEEEEGEEEEEDEDLWESCETGGFDSFMKATEETNAAVMAEDEDAVRNMPCQNNTLTVVLRNPDTVHFVKYLQAAAPSSRVDVHSVFGFDRKVQH